MLAWLALPFACYLLAYLLLNLADLAAGRPWHFFVRNFGMWGHHQWSPLVISIYYAVLIVVAVVVSFLVRRVFSFRLAAMLGWAIGCGTYFLLLDLTWTGSLLFWRGAICGLIAGAFGGFLYYSFTHERTERIA